MFFNKGHVGSTGGSDGNNVILTLLSWSAAGGQLVIPMYLIALGAYEHVLKLRRLFLERGIAGEAGSCVPCRGVGARKQVLLRALRSTLTVGRLKRSDGLLIT